MPEKIDIRVKIFKIRMSERCFRFKPDALGSHAPHTPGVYEFVTFDSQQQPKIVYIGLALDLTIQECLRDHLLNKREPTATQLFSKYPNIYFDYVTQANIKIPMEWKDIAGELIQKNKPELNGSAPIPSSGKHQKIEITEE
ncbi:MAG: hypothetical protein HY399_02930 [Elusimicrobia bacterium]|nr:hypothetical protein [Elusimicrobiota bacterium]